MKRVFLLMMLFLTGCATIALESLKGESKDQILHQLGTPVSVMQESGREMWTYSDNGCAKHIFLDTNGIVVMVQQTGKCSW